jgi:hypothetical protein
MFLVLWSSLMTYTKYVTIELSISLALVKNFLAAAIMVLSAAWDGGTKSERCNVADAYGPAQRVSVDGVLLLRQGL